MPVNFGQGRVEFLELHWRSLTCLVGLVSAPSTFRQQFSSFKCAFTFLGSFARVVRCVARFRDPHISSAAWLLQGYHALVVSSRFFLLDFGF